MGESKSYLLVNKAGAEEGIKPFMETWKVWRDNSLFLSLYVFFLQF